MALVAPVLVGVLVVAGGRFLLLFVSESDGTTATARATTPTPRRGTARSTHMNLLPPWPSGTCANTSVNVPPRSMEK
jgi:hypothetical protein